MLDHPADWYLDNVLVHAEPGGSSRPTPDAVWQAWWRARPATSEPMITARRQGFVVTTAQLDQLGVSRGTRRWAVRRGQWQAPSLGTIAPFELDDDGASEQLIARRRHALVAAAGVLRRPDHAVCARSGAILHGLPTMHVPDLAELAAPAVGGLGRQHPTHSFGARLYACSLAAWFGVPVTSVARTLVDLARHDRRDAIMAADAALRAGLVTMPDIDIEVAEAAGWPGVVQARELLVLADPLAESPLESITRLALHDDGFPPPQLQVWFGPDRVDFYWPDFRFVLEADGRTKYTDDQIWAEKKREQRLRAYAAVANIERVIWADVTQGWPATSARLRRHFWR